MTIKNITRSIILVLIMGLYSSCQKVDVPSDTPRKIKKLIREADDGCLTYVVKMNTDIGALYMFQRFNCLVDKLTYYNDKGDVVCHTDSPPHSCKGQVTFVVNSKETIWDWRDN